LRKQTDSKTLICFRLGLTNYLATTVHSMYYIALLVCLATGTLATIAPAASKLLRWHAQRSLKFLKNFNYYKN